MEINLPTEKKNKIIFLKMVGPHHFSKLNVLPKCLRRGLLKDLVLFSLKVGLEDPFLSLGPWSMGNKSRDFLGGTRCPCFSRLS